MRVVRNEELATWILVPVEPEEEQVVASVTAMLKPEDQLSYGGKSSDGEGDKFCIVNLYAGACKERQSRTKGTVTVTEDVHIGGVKLVLRGSTEDDKLEVNNIRNTCFHGGSAGLIFLGETEVDGRKAIVTTAMRCEHCGADMIRYDSCEWRTCDTCAAKCDHNYVRGFIHGGDVDIGVGEFCDKCGRGKPKAEGEREKTLIEHHLAAEEELGLHVIYQNGPPMTPRQAVEFNRRLRRYARSQSRAKTQ